MSPENAMRCTVYRSSRKEYTYLYLADGMRLDDLPEPLIALFGESEAVVRLDLAERTRLAHADPETVRSRLREEGYYLQLPPDLPVEEELTRRFG
jgi:uncharacterized protein YcgL (UPF0745 family)